MSKLKYDEEEWATAEVEFYAHLFFKRMSKVLAPLPIKLHIIMNKLIKYLQKEGMTYEKICGDFDNEIAKARRESQEVNNE